MKQIKLTQNALITLSMLSMQLVIWLAGFQMALGSIEIIGGCRQLGSLHNYWGSGAILGVLGDVILVLAMLLPPIFIKGLVSRFGRVCSWRRIGILYVATLPLTAIACGVVSLLFSPYHGV